MPHSKIQRTELSPMSPTGAPLGSAVRPCKEHCTGLSVLQCDPDSGPHCKSSATKRLSIRCRQMQTLRATNLAILDLVELNSLVSLSLFDFSSELFCHPPCWFLHSYTCSSYDKPTCMLVIIRGLPIFHFRWSQHSRTSKTTYLRAHNKIYKQICPSCKAAHACVDLLQAGDLLQATHTHCKRNIQLPRGWSMTTWTPLRTVRMTVTQAT